MKKFKILPFLLLLLSLSTSVAHKRKHRKRILPGASGNMLSTEGGLIMNT